MDKNRLVQIANHFDKIGAYTISDEFENKFIRMAAPVDRKGRDPRVQAIIDKTQQPGQVFQKLLNDANTIFDQQFPNINSILKGKQMSYNLIVTWTGVFLKLQDDSSYISDTKKINLLKKINTALVKAINQFEKVKPRSVSSAATDGKIFNTFSGVLANDNMQILLGFTEFVNQEDFKYSGFAEYDNYILALRQAEFELANLRNVSIDIKPLDPTIFGRFPPPTTPSTTTPSTTTPSTTTPSTTTPSTTTPSQAPANPNQGGGGVSTAPSGGGTRPSTRPNSGPKPPEAPSGKPSSKNTNLSVNEELSKIVFRKVKASNPKLLDDTIFLDMRIDKNYKTYLDVSKDKGLDGSIRAAINESSFSNDFKQKLIQRLDDKIAKAIELSRKQDSTSGSTQSTTQITTQSTTSVPTPPEPPKVPAKPDDDGFRCTREGLFTEIGRMDTLHNNDPDKYIRSYFGDIKRVIDCHESLRNSLNLKDNTQLDSLINILEAKYFSEINKTQFPY